jgi:hypothetical protein
MTPARTAQTIIRGADYALGFQRTENSTPISLEDSEFDCVLYSSSNQVLTHPSVDYVSDVQRCINIAHAVTATFAAQTARMELWVTRIDDGYRYMILTARMTIV